MKNKILCGAFILLMLLSISILLIVDYNKIKIKDVSPDGESLILYIKNKNLNILFDTSIDRGTFLGSLKKNNIDLKNIDYIFISHEHPDHSGGLLDLKSEDISPDTKIVINEKVYEELKNRYTKKNKALEALNVIRPSDEFYITPEIIYSKSLDGQGYNKFKNITIPVHEAFLIIKRNNKLTIITGCTHPSIIKMCEYAKQLTKCNKIGAILGGLDIMNCEKTKYLNDSNADLYPIHCSYFEKCKPKRTKKMPLIL